MKIFIWQGETVLKNYTSGCVVLAAETVDAAWDKLKETDFRAWFALQRGINHVFDAEQAEHYDDEFDAYWIIPQPTEYAIEDMPVIVMQGGE